jgi:hypothetical protein
MCFKVAEPYLELGDSAKERLARRCVGLELNAILESSSTTHCEIEWPPCSKQRIVIPEID